MDTLPKHYLLASDFDQTLSFHDSGLVLSELLGISGFHDRVAGLARSNLVQQGGELAYLIRHDPEFRGVRHEHLVEAGRRVRLKGAIPALVEFLGRGFDGNSFSFFVISAAPREIVASALAGIVPPDHIYGTELDFDPRTGEVRAIIRVPAGYGKVAVIEELESDLETRPIAQFMWVTGARTSMSCFTSTAAKGSPSRCPRISNWRGLRTAPFSVTTRSASWCPCWIRFSTGGSGGSGRCSRPMDWNFRNGKRQERIA